jgi:hypothetical protein
VTSIEVWVALSKQSDATGHKEEEEEEEEANVHRFTMSKQPNDTRL